MSWVKDKKTGKDVWVNDGVGNPNKVGDNTTPTDLPNTYAQAQAFLETLGLGNISASQSKPTDTSTTTSQTSVTKLTYNTAKALLLQTVKDTGLNYKITANDIKQFMTEFEKAQNAQIEKVVQIARTQTKPGATEEAQKKVLESVARQEFPSFFKPQDFTSEWLWKKVDFKDETKLGNKAMGVLASVRGLVDAFNLMGVDDNAMRNAAKQIAMGKMTLEEYNVQLQQLAKREYPSFADRFDKDPTLTTKDIATPVINLLAKTWGVPADTIKMSDPLVMSYMNFAGPDGKGKQPSYYDILLKAKQDPKYQLTEEANNDARDMATGLARAFGFGV